MKQIIIKNKILSINTDQIIREEKIGCGAFSEVFRVELKRKISINGFEIDIRRWGVVDPLAEKYPELSPYVIQQTIL